MKRGNLPGEKRFMSFSRNRESPIDLPYRKAGAALELKTVRGSPAYRQWGKQWDRRSFPKEGTQKFEPIKQENAEDQSEKEGSKECGGPCTPARKIFLEGTSVGVKEGIPKITGVSGGGVIGSWGVLRVGSREKGVFHGKVQDLSEVWE